MWSSWELSWFATGLLITMVFGGMAALIVLARCDANAARSGELDPPEYLDLGAPTEVHRA